MCLLLCASSQFRETWKIFQVLARNLGLVSVRQHVRKGCAQQSGEAVKVWLGHNELTLRRTLGFRIIQRTRLLWWILTFSFPQTCWKNSQTYWKHPNWQLAWYRVQEVIFQASNQLSDELKLWDINVTNEKVKWKDGEWVTSCYIRV